jgi:hypothetical protein
MLHKPRPKTSADTEQNLPGFAGHEIARRVNEQGYAVVDLFSQSDILYLQDGYRTVPGEGVSGFHATMYSDSEAYRRSVYALIEPVVTARLNHVLHGYRLRVANWVVKEAGKADSVVGFHQDWSFVDESRFRSINLWFPLMDVDAFNGCLQVVPGSHRISTDPRAHFDRGRFDELGAVLREFHTVAVPLRVGQGIFYDGALLHGSAANQSGHRRVAVGTVLVPEGAPMLHSFRVSSDSVELYAADDAFFWRHQPGARPVGIPLEGKMGSSTTQHGPEILTRLKDALASM